MEREPSINPESAPMVSRETPVTGKTVPESAAPMTGPTKSAAMREATPVKRAVK